MEQEELIQELISASLEAVKPEVFLSRLIRRENDLLWIGDQSCRLDDYAHVYVIAVGKAAVGMAETVDSILGRAITAGIVLTKQLPRQTRMDERWQVLQGGHPLPDQGSVDGAWKILRLLEQAERNDLVLFLISGGGSALMTAPMGGLDLDTMRAFSDQILRCGADINEFNTLRKHLDAVKGGRLAQAAAPAEQITIILSDVVGSPAEIIASGPTVPDNSTYADALRILSRYEGEADFPPRIREVLEAGASGMFPETLDADNPAFARAQVIIAAENPTAAHAAAERAEALGYDAEVLNTRLTGEAREIGALLPSFFSEMPPHSVRIFGGETTVHLKGNGLGGRNQETALAAVRPMASWPGCILFTLATDGEDGLADAAGAVVSAETLGKGLALGCDPDTYLDMNDSWHYFEKTGGLIKTGSSGTNVNDLSFLIRL